MDLICLKFHHMSDCKFITANDFFPVNRRMLFQMGAVFAVHIIILFQFQQWEEEGKPFFMEAT